MSIEITILLSVASLIVGIIATLLISKHYFSKSFGRELAIYVVRSSTILSHISPEIRKNLEIRYKNTVADDLFQLEFSIVNMGERPVSDCVEPLSVELSKEVQVLDSRITYVNPVGRKISLEVQELGNGNTLLRLPFQVLNHGEYFGVQLLLKGYLDWNDLEFNITVDGLPPRIKPRQSKGIRRIELLQKNLNGLGKKGKDLDEWLFPS